MITFYPGPSKVYPQVADYAAQAVREGIVSLNHRSSGFMALVEETLGLLHEKLAIPADYHIAFVSSATECWEIVAQSLTAERSTHLIHGAFAQKWFEYAQKIRPASESIQPAEIGQQKSGEILCLVQNETSNGTQVPMNRLADYRQHTSGLIAVDAVSSLGGVGFDWSLADVWFCSSQKCLGLPAGLGLLIYGPRALARAEAINERDHYNSLLFIHENMTKYQTQYTPNGLGIYCLMRVMQQVPPIAEVEQRIKQQAADWYRFFEQGLTDSPWKLLIQDPESNRAFVRSDTVIAVAGSEAAIKAVKAAASKAGITLGNGYGDWKSTTFRIANFPAIDEADRETLRAFLLDYRLD